MLHFCKEHISCLTVFGALLKGCDDNEDDIHYRRKHKGTYCYLGIPPLDSEEPPSSKRLREVADYCSKNKMQFITECNANAHHIIWDIIVIHKQNAYWNT
jgi:hypothetical protein